MSQVLNVELNGKEEEVICNDKGLPEIHVEGKVQLLSTGFKLVKDLFILRGKDKPEGVSNKEMQEHLHGLVDAGELCGHELWRGGEDSEKT